MTPQKGSRAYTISADKYKTPPDFYPKNEETKRRYLKIYDEYAVELKTQQELADKYGVCQQMISDIVKWAVIHINKTIPKVDVEAKRDAIVERIRRRARKMEDDLNTTDLVKERSYIYRELRLHDRIMGELEGVIQRPGTVSIQDNKKITVVTQQLNRRKGVDEDKQIEDETEVVEIKPDKESE